MNPQLRQISLQCTSSMGKRIGRSARPRAAQQTGPDSSPLLSVARPCAGRDSSWPSCQFRLAAPSYLNCEMISTAAREPDGEKRWEWRKLAQLVRIAPCMEWALILHWNG